MLSHSNQMIYSFVMQHLINNSRIFQSFEKTMLGFVAKNWDRMGREITTLSLESTRISKLLFGLTKLLSPEHNTLMNLCLSQCSRPRTNPDLLEDELKLNFILMEQMDYKIGPLNSKYSEMLI